MNVTFNRRKFLGTTLMASTAIVGPGALVAFLSQEDAATRVYAILKTHLQVDSSHMPLVEQFTRSLLNSERHHQSASAARETMKKAEIKLAINSQKELELYVVEEFMVSTNYLAYSAAQEFSLHMLEVRGASAATAALLS